MLDLDPFASLENGTQGLSKSLYYGATNAVPHSISESAPYLLQLHKIFGMKRNVVIEGEAWKK